MTRRWRRFPWRRAGVARRQSWPLAMAWLCLQPHAEIQPLLAFCRKKVRQLSWMRTSVTCRFFDEDLSFRARDESADWKAFPFCFATRSRSLGSMDEVAMTGSWFSTRRFDTPTLKPRPRPTPIPTPRAPCRRSEELRDEAGVEELDAVACDRARVESLCALHTGACRCLRVRDLAR